MIRNTIVTLAIIFLGLTLFSCKAEELAPVVADYIFTVETDTGVSGQPASGTYHHKEGSTVEYAYELIPGYENLTVLKDGVQIAASGSLTVQNNHMLRVKCDRINYFKGNWVFQYTWSKNSCDPDYFPNGSDQGYGSQAGDDVSLSVPLRGVLLTGTADCQGNFVMSGVTIDDYHDLPAEYRHTVSGKMDSLTQFTAQAKIVIARNGAQICSVTGKIVGRKL